MCDELPVAVFKHPDGRTAKVYTHYCDECNPRLDTELNIGLVYSFDPATLKSETVAFKLTGDYNTDKRMLDNDIDVIGFRPIWVEEADDGKFLKGWLIATKESVARNYPSMSSALVQVYLTDELDMLVRYLEGRVYGFIITDKEGKILDQSSGYFMEPEEMLAGEVANFCDFVALEER